MIVAEPTQSQNPGEYGLGRTAMKLTSKPAHSATRSNGAFERRLTSLRGNLVTARVC